MNLMVPIGLYDYKLTLISKSTNKTKINYLLEYKDNLYLSSIKYNGFKSNLIDLKKFKNIVELHQRKSYNDFNVKFYEIEENKSIEMKIIGNSFSESIIFNQILLREFYTGTETDINSDSYLNSNSFENIFLHYYGLISNFVFRTIGFISFLKFFFDMIIIKKNNLKNIEQSDNLTNSISHNFNLNSQESNYLYYPQTNQMRKIHCLVINSDENKITMLENLLKEKNTLIDNLHNKIANFNSNQENYAKIILTCTIILCVILIANFIIKNFLQENKNKQIQTNFTNPIHSDPIISTNSTN